MTESLTGWTLRRLKKALRGGEVSAEETARAYLRQIEEQEPRVGAFLTVTAGEALEQARAVDAARARGEALPDLAGVPVALKDNLCTKGVRTTCASRMLERFVPPYDAHVAGRLRAQGAVLLGKTNLDEFAMGSTTEHSAFHPTRNPRDPSRVPGGSSGGSAAAVAAGEAAFALGSDTGGSIRQPAAFCGVVGLRPTYGLVSRFGLVAFASSLDQAGPITRDVSDCAAALNAIAGHDARDAMSLPDRASGAAEALEQGVRGLRVGLVEEFFSGALCAGLDGAVRRAVLAAARRLEGLGARVAWVSLPSLADALPAYCVLSSAEASSNLARFDGVRFGSRPVAEQEGDGVCRCRGEGFGDEVKRRILLGAFALSAGARGDYYSKALLARERVRRDLRRALGDFDALLSPVTPITAYPLGEKLGHPLQMLQGDVFTVPASLGGLPALSMPCGEDGGGLPIGMQLTGAPLSEGTLLRLGYAFEQDRGGRLS